MEKVKGLKKLNKAISAQLKPFGIDFAVCSDTYQYTTFEDDTTMVEFKPTENSIEDGWFRDFIETRFNYKVEYPFVISLLHEVGHHKTLEDISGTVAEFCIAEKERINEEMQIADGHRSKELNYEYFNLPDEIVATAWAVEWAKKHPKKVKKIWKHCEEAFHEIYRKNGVTE